MLFVVLLFGHAPRLTISPIGEMTDPPSLEQGPTLEDVHKSMRNVSAPSPHSLATSRAVSHRHATQPTSRPPSISPSLSAPPRTSRFPPPLAARPRQLRLWPTAPESSLAPLPLLQLPRLPQQLQRAETSVLRGKRDREWLGLVASLPPWPFYKLTWSVDGLLSCVSVG